MAAIKKLIHIEPMKRFMFRRRWYKEYGLLLDDMLYETPQVQEAVRRLPQKVKDDRTYRFIRAHQLAVQNSILPEEQWTKYEEDKPYLRPYLEEVQAEEKERAEWNKNPLESVKNY